MHPSSPPPPFPCQKVGNQGGDLKISFANHLPKYPREMFFLTLLAEALPATISDKV